MAEEGLTAKIKLEADADEVKAMVASAEAAFKVLQTAGKEAGDALSKAFDTLNIRPSSAIRDEIASIKQAYDTLAASGKASQAELSRAHDAMQAKISALNKEIRGAVQASDGFGVSIQRLQNIFIAYQSAVAAANSTKWVVDTADAYQLMDGRLKLVTNSAQELVQVQQDLHAVAERSRMTYLDTANVFSRFASATKGTGISQAELVKITETLNKAFVLSGSSTTEATAAMQQLSQGFASGVLRGDEFNSVMESGGRVADLLAAHLGVSRGALRKMAEDGKITGDVMRAAFAGGFDVINEEFSKLPMTVGQAATLVKSSFADMTAQWMQASGASETLVAGLSILKGNLAEVAEGAVRLTAAAGTMWLAFNADAAIASLKRLAASVSETVVVTSKLQQAALGAAAGFAGWELGTWLNNFEVVRQAGVSLVIGLEKVIAAVGYAKDVLSAPFTSDTWDEASRRYQSRLDEIDKIGVQMWQDASNGAQQAAAGADIAAKSIASVGAATVSATDATKQLETAIKAIGDPKTYSGALDGIQQITMALVDARKKGGEALNDTLVKIGDTVQKLSAGELAKFTQGLEDAFMQGQIGASEYLDLIDKALPAAFEKLGIDQHKATTGISKDFSELVSLLQETAKSAELTGAEIAQAVDKMRASADTTDDFRALNKEVKELGDAGKLAGDELDHAFRSIAKDALDEFYNSLKKATDAATIRQLRKDLEEMYQDGVIGTNQYKESLADLDAALANVTATQDMTRAEAEQYRETMASLSSEVDKGNAAIEKQVTAQAAAAEQMNEYSRTARDAINETFDLSGETGDLSRSQEQAAKAAQVHADNLKQEADRLDKAVKSEHAKLEANRKQYEALRSELAEEKARLNMMQASGQATQAELNIQLARVQALEKATQAAAMAVQTQARVVSSAEAAASALHEEAAAANDAATGLASVAGAAEGASDALDGVSRSSRHVAASITIPNSAVAMQRALESISEKAARATGSFDLMHISLNQMVDGLTSIDTSSIDSLNEGLALTEQYASSIAFQFGARYDPRNIEFIANHMNRIVAQAQAELRVMHQVFEETRHALELGEQLDNILSNDTAAYEKIDSILGGIGSDLQSQAADLQSWIASAEDAIASVQYLDDEHLDNLRAGIEQAKQELIALAEESMAAKEALSDAANSYNEQILRMRGDDEALENLRHQREMERLQELFEKGGANAQAEYDEAVSKEEELHRLKLADIEERNQRETERQETSHQQSLERVDETSKKESEAAKKQHKEQKERENDLHDLKMGHIKEQKELEQAISEAAKGFYSVADAQVKQLKLSMKDFTQQLKEKIQPHLAIDTTAQCGAVKTVQITLQSNTQPGATATVTASEDDYQRFLDVLASEGMRAA